MKYRIYRECWNERTYNGHIDSPYWRILFDSYEIGLKDDGSFWSINRNDLKDIAYIKNMLKTIIEECKLNIQLSTEL